MKSALFTAIVAGMMLCPAEVIYGQHDQHTSGASPSKNMKRDETGRDSVSRAPMTHAFSLNLPVSRNGSGTGWLPDTSNMYGYMVHAEKWMFMAHGNVFFRYTNQDVFQKGSRGDDKFDIINWFMFMGQRKAGARGLFHFNTMFSLDALFGGNGYPLLFQTGESWEGEPLVDRQHPHDLIAELSVSYTYSINNKTDAYIYAGYPGEPALGSVAFMHRNSSSSGPDAPLNHHWNDGTHITFGVLTAGIRFGKMKMEVSSFTGREPDEHRYGFDTPRFDSYSGRVSYNPNASWAFQVSGGFVKSPESIHPDEDVVRVTASAILSKPLTDDHFLNLTALWGMNSSEQVENAVLAEAVVLVRRWSVYGRYELVGKSREELDLDEIVYGEQTIFPINAFSLGSSYDLMHSNALNIAIGVQGTVYAADNRLDDLYGKNPVSAEIFLRLYPPLMFMGSMR